MAGQTKSIIITIKAKQSDHTKNDKMVIDIQCFGKRLQIEKQHKM